VSKALFVTGTDTNVGKTYISTLLLKALNKKGLQTFAIKPIASGCYPDRLGNLRNEDAILLRKHASLKQPYKVVNPIRFQKPIAPHIAAIEEGVLLSSKILVDTITNSMNLQADVNIIEGAGGWFLPLNDDDLLSDVIKQLKISVVLVVGVRLGCLNHALLTYRAIEAQKIPCIGWVANCIDDNMLNIEDNIATLKAMLPVPCLGTVAYGNQDEQVLDVDFIQSSLL